MVESRRTRKIAFFAMAGVLLAMAVVMPSYAHNDIVSTNTQCTSPTGCSLTTTTSVKDTANLCISIEGDCNVGTTVSNSCVDTTTSDTTQEGTLCFLVYQAPSTATSACSGNSPVTGSTQISPTQISPTASPVPRSDDTTSYKYYPFTSTLTLSASTPAGLYAWIVQYSPSKYDKLSGNSLYQLQTCEQFQLTGKFPPLPSAPEFPLGMVLVLALAIPGLLLIRSKYSSSPISV